MPVTRFPSSQDGRAGHFTHPYLPAVLRQTKLPYQQASSHRLALAPEPNKERRVQQSIVPEGVKQKYPNQPWKWSDRENEPPRPVPREQAMATTGSYKNIESLTSLSTDHKTWSIDRASEVTRPTRMSLSGGQSMRPAPGFTAHSYPDSSMIGSDGDDEGMLENTTVERNERRRILQQENWVGLPTPRAPAVPSRCSGTQERQLWSTPNPQELNKRPRIAANSQDTSRHMQEADPKSGIYDALAANFGRASDHVPPAPTVSTKAPRTDYTPVKSPSTIASQDHHASVSESTKCPGSPLGLNTQRDEGIVSHSSSPSTPPLTATREVCEPLDVAIQPIKPASTSTPSQTCLAPTKSEVDALCEGLFSPFQHQDGLFLPDLSDDEAETPSGPTPLSRLTCDPTRDQKRMIDSIHDDTLIVNSQQDLLDLLDNLDNTSMYTGPSSCFPTINEQKKTAANARDIIGKIKRIEINTFLDEDGLKKLHNVACDLHRADKNPIIFKHLESIKLASNAINAMYALIVKINAAERAARLMMEFASIGDPQFLCLEFGWFPSFGKPFKTALTTLRQRWSRLEAVHVHRVHGDLPFFLPGVTHCAHFTDQAWPFQGDPGYVIDASENVEYDELDEDPSRRRFSYPRHVNKLQMCVKYTKENVADAIKLEVYREQQALEDARRALKRRCSGASKAQQVNLVDESSDGEEREVSRLHQAVKRADKAVTEAEWSGQTRWIVSYPKLDGQRQTLLDKAIAGSDGVLRSRVEWYERKGRIRCEGCGWRA